MTAYLPFAQSVQSAALYVSEYLPTVHDVHTSYPVSLNLPGAQAGVGNGVGYGVGYSVGYGVGYGVGNGVGYGVGNGVGYGVGNGVG